MSMFFKGLGYSEPLFSVCFQSIYIGDEMERLFICLLLLSSIGYALGLIWEFENEYDIDKFIYYANMHVENKNNIITSDEKKDISNYKGNKSHISIPTSYSQIINRTSYKYRIEPYLVSAVIKVESNWDSQAVSRKGAKGLMQLMPSTAKEMNVKNPFDPEENIEGGTRYLRYLLDRFNGDIILALAAYNAGPNRVEKFRDIPPIKETKQYVKKVLSIYNGQGINL
jgi:soluble lytic murein transglycosylase-like protein